MAKSVLKKAKKAAKSVKKEVKSASSSAKSNVGNVRAHIEKYSGEQGECATIWRVINNNPKYTTEKEILDLIKLKNYSTLLGEVS